MSAAISTMQMSQLVDALDHEDLPTLLLDCLNTIVSFDLYALFLYDKTTAPTYLCSNFPTEVEERSLHRFSSDTFRYHPFYQHHLKGIDNGIYFMRELSRSAFLQRPVRESDSIRLCGNEEIGYITQGFPNSLTELDITLHLDAERTLQVGIYRHGHATFSPDEVSKLASLFPLVQSLLTRYLSTWLANRQSSPREHLYRMGIHSLSEFLSPREAEIVGLILKGYSSKEISEKLKISTETVKTHRKNAYQKLEISTTVELVSRFLDDIATSVRVPFGNETQTVVSVVNPHLASMYQP
ncbi:MAG: response regulator transcription factor [Paenalcaligenes sp.]